jgi:hypothetical protein
MKYAFPSGGIISVISYEPQREIIIDYQTVEAEDEAEGVQIETGRHWGDLLRGWIEVSDEVFAGFIDDGEGGWKPPPSGPEDPPSSVTARQFKLQLLEDDLLDQVDAWIASQDRATQIAYQFSGSFVRSEPMMQNGFAALGFSDEKVDEFFISASKL